jgi:hypothetical protein
MFEAKVFKKEPVPAQLAGYLQEKGTGTFFSTITSFSKNIVFKKEPVPFSCVRYNRATVFW